MFKKKMDNQTIIKIIIKSSEIKIPRLSTSPDYFIISIKNALIIKGKILNKR